MASVEMLSLFFELEDLIVKFNKKCMNKKCQGNSATYSNTTMTKPWFWCRKNTSMQQNKVRKQAQIAMEICGVKERR